MNTEQAAKVMAVVVLVVGVLCLGMGIGTTAGVVVVGDGCNFQPENVNSPQLTEPPACQEHAEQLSMWSDCLFTSGFFLLGTGLAFLLYLQWQAQQPKDSGGVADGDA